MDGGNGPSRAEEGVADKRPTCLQEARRGSGIRGTGYPGKAKRSQEAGQRDVLKCCDGSS